MKYLYNVHSLIGLEIHFSQGIASPLMYLGHKKILTINAHVLGLLGFEATLWAWYSLTLCVLEAFPPNMVFTEAYLVKQ